MRGVGNIHPHIQRERERERERFDREVVTYKC